MKLLLAGGHQARLAGVVDRDHRSLYDQAILAELDTDSLTLTSVLRHDASRFAAPSVDGPDVILCTDREVLVLRDRALVERWTHPAMDDLHHATRDHQGLLAVSTGRDLLLRHPDETHPASDHPGRDTVHANYTFLHHGDRWVTRGTTHDALRLRDRRRVPLADVVVHDGVPDGEHTWFTAVDGHLLQADLAAGTVRAHDLHQDEGPEPLGWCRGLAIHDGVAWVGFSRLRATRARQNLAWVKGRLRGVRVATRRPTRVIAVELATGRRLATVELAPVGIDALFGLAVRP